VVSRVSLFGGVLAILSSSMLVALNVMLPDSESAYQGRVVALGACAEELIGRSRGSVSDILMRGFDGALISSFGPQMSARPGCYRLVERAALRL
jgi:hypothetical protein